MAKFPKPETHFYLGAIHGKGRHFDVYLGLDQRYTIVLRGRQRQVVASVDSFSAIEQSIAEHIAGTEGESGSPSVPAAQPLTTRSFSLVTLLCLLFLAVGSVLV